MVNARARAIRRGARRAPKECMQFFHSCMQVVKSVYEIRNNRHRFVDNRVSIDRDATVQRNNLTLASMRPRPLGLKTGEI